MDQPKLSAIFYPFNSVLTPPLDGIPPAPPISKSFASENSSFSVNLKKYSTLDEMFLHLRSI